MKAKIKFPKIKKISLSKAKDRAWKAFAKWYRKNATKDGPVACYTCDKPTEFESIQPGHWMTGHTNTNYINMDYIRPQCTRCNIFNKGEQGIFWERIEEEIGTERFEYLRIHNTDFKDISVEDYLLIEFNYKKKLEALK
jgi:hypothetical protein